MQFSSVYFFPANFRYGRLKVIWQEFQSAPDQSSRSLTLSFINRVFSCRNAVGKALISAPVFLAIVALQATCST